MLSKLINIWELKKMNGGFMLFKNNKEIKITELTKGLLKDEEKSKLINLINKNRFWKDIYYTEQLLTDHLPTLKKDKLPRELNIRKIIQ